MPVSTRIDPNEFKLMRDYIEQSCGIHLTDEKVYLVETRLTTLMIESGCATFSELYKKATADTTRTLRDKIIDAMTTNETLWFRDGSPFEILQKVLLEKLCAEIIQKKRTRIKIWCAACSTGQEPYSIAMLIREIMHNFPSIKPHHFTITGTDISPTVIFLAKAGRYDHLAISRGLPKEYKNRYFTPRGKTWEINHEIKAMVTYTKLNLQETFSLIEKQDIVFCRNVLIYFSDDFKKDILTRLAAVLRPEGYLFLGASESIINYSREYEMHKHKRGLYYKVKNT